MQPYIALYLLGLLSLSEQSKRSALGADEERDLKRRRTEVSSDSLMARISDLQCQALELKKSTWELQPESKSRLLQAAHSMWLKIPSDARSRFVGLTSHGYFEELPAVPEVFSKGYAKGAPTDVLSVIPDIIDFHALIRQLQSYIRNAEYFSLTCVTGKRVTEDRAGVVQFFTEKGSVKNKEGQSFSLPAEVWDVILCGSNAKAAEELEEILSSERIYDLSIDRFMGYINRSTLLSTAVKVIAPHLIKKHVPLLYNEASTNQMNAEDEGAHVTNLSLGEQLLVAPVVLAESQAMMSFVEKAHNAAFEGPYSESKFERWGNIKQCMSTMYTIFPRIRSSSSTTSKVDMFLLGAAAKLLNHDEEVTRNVSQAVDVLNKIYGTSIST